LSFTSGSGPIGMSTLMNPLNLNQIECEDCKKFVYQGTTNTKLKCKHLICTSCAPKGTRRCPICKDGTMLDCCILICFV
jgi:hypothetical protein